MIAPLPLAPEELRQLTAVIARLTHPPAAVPPPPQPGDLPQLLQRVVARPWRRSAVDARTRADLEVKVRSAVARGDPIEFSVPFGGYKSWRQPSFPRLDWAEVFWVDYLRSYARQLAALHSPGVRISFTHTRGVLGWINNLDEADETAYLLGLEQLMRRQSTPDVQLVLVDHAPAYGGSAQVLRILQERERAMPEPTPPELASARRNLRMPAAPGLAGERTLEPSAAAVAQAARRCAALLSLERRRDFNKHGPRIQLTHVRGASLSIHVGSCRTACAQPWVSSGYLEWRPGQASWIECLSTDPAQVPELGEYRVDHPLAALSPALQVVRLRRAAACTFPESLVRL